ncbi:class II fructose-bisphosphate aldolase [Desnuesiella massiliensis]|uniref:class II fructose-bisphosphate aldolase n=1 Tax=Desnuesiella massiliensis TaxID=1650662 RepID=UPI0006E45A67|nr:class II fructose-bisphosphate aldolase [Desnuesiella massiliensis]
MYVSMKEMLWHAHENNYAVMAINCVNMEQAKAIIQSASEEHSAVIINISPRQMKAHGHPEILAPMIRNMAEKVQVPVAFNLDHGANYEDIAYAIQCGFSSVMIDASGYEFEENIKRTSIVASLAHSKGLSCEAELGHVGLANQQDNIKADLYTNVGQACEFVQRTHCDCLAVAIGTAHGSYSKGFIPTLDFERLRLLKEALEMPLALHGGSGAGDENIKKVVAYGINKINVCTDLFKYARQSMADAIAANPNIDYMDVNIAAQEAMKKFIKRYMRLIGSSGRYTFEKSNGPEFD